MTKTNLMLHCGARYVDRNALAQVPCPPSTSTWFPIPHIKLVEEVERSLTASNMRIVNEAFGLTKDNERMFGLLQVANCVETKDYAYVIGLRGSVDKSLSRGLAVGSSVFVCDNMAFSAEIVMNRKQTRFILDDLPKMVDSAIGRLSLHWNNQNTRIEAYKNKEISDRDAAYLLMERLAGPVFPVQRLPDVYQEFKNPRHPEFQKNTLWTLFNGITEHLKPRDAESKASGLWKLPARTFILHKVCDDYAGVKIDTSITPTPEATTPAVEAPAPVQNN